MTSTIMTSTACVIGTGRMGSALAGALLKAGHATHVWNRSPAKYTPLLALGARPAATVREAVSAADIIIVNVIDYDAAHQVLNADDVRPALAGKLVVQLTSGSPGQARKTAAWAAQASAAYLDGAIMATPDFVGTPGGTILYAGPTAPFEQHRSLLLALGGNAQHVGSDVGHASALDAALLVQMWGALFGALIGAVVAEAEGLPQATFMEQFSAFKPVVDAAVVDTATRTRAGRLAGDAATLASLGAHHSAFRQLLALCDERAIDRSIPDAFDRFFRAALDAGHADDDFALLSRYLRHNDPR